MSYSEFMKLHEKFGTEISRRASILGHQLGMEADELEQEALISLLDYDEEMAAQTDAWILQRLEWKMRSVAADIRRDGQRQERWMGKEINLDAGSPDEGIRNDEALTTGRLTVQREAIFKADLHTILEQMPAEAEEIFWLLLAGVPKREVAEQVLGRSRLTEFLTIKSSPLSELRAYLAS